MSVVTPIVRVAELFERLKVLLNTAGIGDILGGLDRVYLVGDDYSTAEAPGDVPWGRIVLVPTQNLWGDDTQLSFLRPISFLVRIELNRYMSSGYDPSYILEAAHVQCQELLESYAPVMTNSLVGIPVYLASAPQAFPLWDDSRGLWFTSAEYRCEVSARSS